MTDHEQKVRDIVAYLPASKRAALERAAEVGQMSVGAALAMSLASEPIRDYCPPGERALVAGLLMRVYLDEAKR